MKKNSTPGEFQERKPAALSGAPSRESGKEIQARRSFITRDLRSALPHLKNSEVKVWLCFSSHANRDGFAWPSDRTVARETGLAFHTVRLAKVPLIKAGVLQPTEQLRKAGRYWVKPFLVVEPSPGMFGSTDMQKVCSGEAPTDDHSSTMADDHFSTATDVQFLTPHQERSPSLNVSTRKSFPISGSGVHRKNNGYKKLDEQVREFFTWWKGLYTQKYGFEPNIPRNASGLLKGHLLRGEPLQQVQTIAAAYLDDPNTFYAGHSISSLLGSFYDRFKAMCQVQQVSQASGENKQEQDPYRDLEVRIGEREN